MTIEADRARLIANDPIAQVIQRFLDSDMASLEMICPPPGTVLDSGVRFIESEGVTPEKMYSRIYTIALRGHWLKSDIWLRKRGDTVTLYKYDPKDGV